MRILASILLATVLTGCSDRATTLLAGPGTTLLVGDTHNRVDLQDGYFKLMCQGAGAVDGKCRVNDAGDWERATYVALNDIDDRCEMYVNSLHRAKREGDSYIAMLTRTSTATNTVLGQMLDKASQRGARAIAIVQAAFNLGENSINTYYSRLLLAVPPTDVQQLILKRQTAFRVALRDGVKDSGGAVRYMPLASRSDAYYVIRSYLRICLPASIEAAISEGIDDLVFFAPPTPPPPVERLLLSRAALPAVAQPARRIDPDVGALAVRK